jgi:hypothetical protein
MQVPAPPASQAQAKTVSSTRTAVRLWTFAVEATDAQIRIVPALSPLASRALSGAIATMFTGPVWLVRVARGVLSATQIRTVLSPPPLASQVQSGPVATVFTGPVWPVRVARRLFAAATAVADLWPGSETPWPIRTFDANPDGWRSFAVISRTTRDRCTIVTGSRRAHRPGDHVSSPRQARYFYVRPRARSAQRAVLDGTRSRPTGRR